MALEFPLQIAVPVNGGFVLLGPLNRDQKLDEGGANEVTAAQLKTLVALLGTLELTTNKNQAGGYLGIDAVTGKVDPQFIPAVALNKVTPVANQAAMLALVAQGGDAAKRADENGKVYMLKENGNPTVLADWIPLTGGIAVDSVNGEVGVVTLNADKIAETATRLWVSTAEKAVWNAKQNALVLDAQPTLNSVNFVNSDAVFKALQDKSATVEVKLFTGNQLDGDNRLNLAPADKKIDRVMVTTINGIVQVAGVHYTSDANGRYIEFPVSTHNAASDHIQVVYFADTPMISLNTVEMSGVSGLTGPDGKILSSNLPEGVGGPVETAFTSVLKFDKDYAMEHIITGDIAFTLNAGSIANNDQAKKKRQNTVYLRANGVNKPTFSANDFVIYSDSWDNSNLMWNRIYFEYLPSGKVLVDITYLHSA
mgnify:CR=1 FL=1